MDFLIWVIAFAIGYWWQFQRETRSEREYREKQQRKKEQWNKNNMDKFK